MNTRKKNIYRVLEPSPWTVPTNLRCPAKTKKHITTYTATTHHILTQWSFSAASVFAGSSWYERHWHVFNSFLSSMIAPYSNGYVPHQQQNQQASLPSERMNMAAQNKRSQQRHAMPCFCAWSWASMPASINTQLHHHNSLPKYFWPLRSQQQLRLHPANQCS